MAPPTKRVFHPLETPQGPRSGLTPHVLFACSVQLYRQAFPLMLARYGWDCVTTCGADHAEILMAIALTSPEVVLLDIRTPSGRKLLSSLTAAPLGVPLVAIGNTDPDLPQGPETLVGYVQPGVNAEQLQKIVKSLLYGSCLARSVVGSGAGLAEHSPPVRGPGTEVVLTGREQEIVELAARGLSNKEIAQCLAVATATVRNHLHNVFAKTQVHRRTQVIAHHLRKQVVAIGRPDARNNPANER